jgi:hypothetical protein
MGNIYEKKSIIYTLADKIGAQKRADVSKQNRTEKTAM